mgnify:CR=1 FL=1
MPDLIWKHDITVSISTVDGWQGVTGDVLSVDGREALSVHCQDSSHLWILSHVPTGRQIVGFGSRVEAHHVAEKLAADVPAWLWAETRGRKVRTARLLRMAEAVKPVLFPLLDGRRYFRSGEWIDQGRAAS